MLPSAMPSAPKKALEKKTALIELAGELAGYESA